MARAFQFAYGPGVDAGEGFVQQEVTRFSDQGPGDFHPTARVGPFQSRRAVRTDLDETVRGLLVAG